jgi:pimeloyl-ACP methyl ester carboxylesterase
MRLVKQWVDVAAVMPRKSPARLAVNICFPDAGVPLSGVVYCCIPGGGMNAAYFDLRFDDDESFSFAARMACAGAVTVLVNPLGVGGSTVPEDGFAVGLDTLIDADALAVTAALEALRRGTADEHLPPLTGMTVIGVGHSMGGMFTLMQQARHRSYAALVLMGFSLNGMPQILTPAEAACAGDAAAARANVAELAHARFREPFPILQITDQSRSLLKQGDNDKGVRKAIVAARDRMIAIGAMFALIPGSVAPEAAAIDVPLLLLFGQQDICGAPHQVPPSFPKVTDLELFVLPQSGHNHFTAASRAVLFDRIKRWTSSLREHPHACAML